MNTPRVATTLGLVPALASGRMMSRSMTSPLSAHAPAAITKANGRGMPASTSPLNR